MRMKSALLDVERGEFITAIIAAVAVAVDV